MTYQSRVSQKAPPSKKVRLWDKDGNSKLYHPIDAKEILASENGYTLEDPEFEAKKADEKEVKAVEEKEAKPLVKESEFEPERPKQKAVKSKKLNGDN